MTRTISESLTGTIGERLFPLAQRILQYKNVTAIPEETRAFGLLLVEMWFVLASIKGDFGGSIPAMECRSIVQEAEGIINGEKE